MTDTSGLHQSLAAMGFLELALAFVALACYSLVLNAALGATGRTLAAGIAAVAASGFTVLTDPWMNGVGLVAIGVAGLGLFVAALWAVSAVCRVVAHTMRQPLQASGAADDATWQASDLAEVAEPAAAPLTAPAPLARPHVPSQPHQA